MMSGNNWRKALNYHLRAPHQGLPAWPRMFKFTRGIPEYLLNSLLKPHPIFPYQDARLHSSPHSHRGDQSVMNTLVDTHEPVGIHMSIRPLHIYRIPIEPSSPRHRLARSPNTPRSNISSLAGASSPTILPSGDEHSWSQGATRHPYLKNPCPIDCNKKWLSRQGHKFGLCNTNMLS